jgi:hypothetical protein
MEIAALISFGVLLVAWLIAPDGRAASTPAAAEAEREALPVAA